MHKNSFTLSLLFGTVAVLLVSCRTAPIPTQLALKSTASTVRSSPNTPTASITQTESSSPNAGYHPVWIISWDGAPANEVYRLIENGDLPTFHSLQEQGLRSDYLRSVTPSLTAPAQNSLASGSLPNRTGIVSNRYHLSSDNFYWYRTGFEDVMDEAEPLWVSGSKAGLMTATLFFPGATPNHPTQSADYTVGYGQRDAYSRQETLLLHPAVGWENSPSSYSPLLETEYQIPKVKRVYFLVVDQTDDRVVNYDSVYLSLEKVITSGSPLMRMGDWAPLLLLADVSAGADFLLQELTNDVLTFYHSGVYHNSASPRAMLAEINKKFGFYRQGGDSYALEHGWINEDQFITMVERNAIWMAEVSSWVYENYRPDLIFAWQEVFDSTGHVFYLRDSHQVGYEASRVNLYTDFYLQAANIADRALDIILRGTDLMTATVFLVSDHGMTPVHTNVYVNTVLEQNGLLVLDERNYVVVEESKALAFTSGGAMHIYINLIDHERDGFVDHVEYPAVKEQIIDLYLSLRDPDSGEGIFQIVLDFDDLGSLGLDHPNSGDIFALAYPGYNLDSWRGKEFVFSPSTLLGQHGFDNQHPDMWGIFIAAGHGIHNLEQDIDPINLIDIAPSIARFLDIPPSATSDGVVIPLIAGD